MAKHQKGEKYLKNDQYYSDLYDLFTINRCLDIVRFYQKAYKEQFNNKAIKDLPKEEKYKGFSYFLHWELLSTRTSRYKDKEETIKEWIERDTNYQYKYDNAIEPTYYCPKCNTQTKSTFKTLINYIDKEPDRMLFFMECDTCNKRYGVYADGQVRESKPDLCPKCNKEVTVTSKHKGKIYTFTTKCKSCHYKDVRTEDYEKSRIEREKKEQEDKELLEKYRNEFCFNDKEGKEYVELFEARTRRLEKEPDGFYLDSTDGSGYSCGICGGFHEENKVWWNSESIRCSNCWENMKAGVIPKDIMHRYDKDKQWISDWEFKDKYGLHSAIRDKLTRQGFLKVRELKNPLGQIYCSVYLKKENKPFRDKYPKIPKTEPKITVTTSSSKNQ